MWISSNESRSKKSKVPVKKENLEQPMLLLVADGAWVWCTTARRQRKEDSVALTAVCVSGTDLRSSGLAAGTVR